MVTVTEYKPAEAKGRLSLRFDNGITVLLYRSEARRFHLSQDASVTEEEFACLLDEVVGKRAKKRALHLLEQMDRTEHQLREKLARGGYPQVCIDGAIDYVKSYHYLDDYRYACAFVRCHEERMSRLGIRQKLSGKGIAREVIERAIDDTYESVETAQIAHILTKRRFSAAGADEKEFRRTYQYLLRRGYSGSEILREMRAEHCS